MAVSVFELFKIGIGPSSSHTVGPMLAAHTFVQRLMDENLVKQVERLQVTLFGSLAFTGRGHGTDKAVMLGLSGELPDKIDPDNIVVPLIEISGIGESDTGTCGIENWLAINTQGGHHRISVETADRPFHIGMCIIEIAHLETEIDGRSARCDSPHRRKQYNAKIY